MIVSVVDVSGDDSGSENEDEDEVGSDVVVEDDSDEDSGKTSCPSTTIQYGLGLNNIPCFMQVSLASRCWLAGVG